MTQLVGERWDQPLDGMAAEMNRLPMVTWDRCVIRDLFGGVVYGWIRREDDGRSDFVVLEFAWRALVDEGWDVKLVGLATSSAVYSAEIARILLGADADHKDCERVEHVFGSLVERKVEL